jgi:hypothetical protein
MSLRSSSEGRIVYKAAALALLLIVLTSVYASSQPRQQRWAAIDPNREGSSPVAWGPTEAEARQRAIDACKRTSKTCANGPASTDDMEDVFAVMCCSRPSQGCAVSVAGSRQEAAKSVQKIFSDAGFSGCSLRHYLSAATGRKQ